MTLFIISFIAGVLTVLAPCILPLLPVILGGAVAEAGNRRRPLVIIASLSLSVFIFTLLLKGSTALINVSPSFWTYVSAVILFIFGLTLLFPITWAKIMLRVPGHNKPDAWLAKGYTNKTSWWSDVLVGAALGPVFTTCSPTFFVILATVLPQSLGMGLIDLAAYILGLALVLLLISWIGQKLVDKLGWATDPNGLFKRILGVLFIVLAVLIAFGYDKKLETSILNAGFFDVTNVEQSIHQALQGPTTLPGQNGSNQVPESASSSNPSAQNNPANPANPAKLNPANPTKPQPSSSANNLPPPPAEHNEGRYVEIAKPAGFVNSQPFKLSDLVGKKVILIDFVDYSCINCERTFPYLKDWYSKYKDQGLEIVAIHTPEFAFEQDINNVTAAANQFGLKFPIVLDNSYATWNAYGNQYWPHKYLIDIHGNVVYDHIGEGSYDETESEIVKLLNDRMKFLGQEGTVSTGTSTMPTAPQIQTASPETYFGAMRNDSFANGDPERRYEKTFTIPDALEPNQFYLGGDWKIEDQYAESKADKDQLSFVFAATNMYIVAQPADGVPSVTAQVLLDGKPMPDSWAGADVKNGKLTIDSSRLYHLFSNPNIGRHRIDIIFPKGVRAFTFTFG